MTSFFIFFVRRLLEPTDLLSFSSEETKLMLSSELVGFRKTFCWHAGEIHLFSFFYYFTEVIIRNVGSFL